MPIILITKHLYDLCQDLLTLLIPQNFEGLLSTFLGWIHATLHDLNDLLPPYASVKKELENHSMFFMTLDMYGLPQEYDVTCDQILGLPTHLL